MPKKTTTTTKKPTTKKKVDEKKEEKIVDEVIVEEEVLVEEPKEEEVEEKTVEIVEEAVQDKRPVKRDVKIKMAKDHKCSIGGEFYNLKAGCTYNVPEFVKTVLAGAGVLSPL